jgi:hypothetical protein
MCVDDLPLVVRAEDNLEVFVHSSPPKCIDTTKAGLVRTDELHHSASDYAKDTRETQEGCEAVPDEHEN